MPSGSGFTETQIEEVARAIASASRDTGLHFSAYVGPPDGSVGDYAQRLHTALGERASSSVLVYVAPGERQLEIVTGKEAARRVNDRVCALAALAMTSSFAGGDLPGGLVNGVRMLSEAAGRVRQPQH